MPQSLASYHFNPVKLGQILHQLAKDKGISKACIQRATGIHRDTLANIFHGETQEVSFEKLFKLCYVLEVPVSVVEMLLLKDEDIDFADKVLYHDPSGGSVVPSTDVDPSQLPVTETVVAVAEAVAAAETSTPAPTPPVTAEYVAFLQAHIDHLTRLLEMAMRNSGAYTL